MDDFDPSSMRNSMKLDFGGGSTQVPTPGPIPVDTKADEFKLVLESPSFISLLNQLSNEGKTAAELLNTFKAPQYKPAQQLPTPTPTALLFPDKVTNDQLQYAQGFLDALTHVQRANNFKQPVLDSPSLLDHFKPLVNCLSPQASPVNQPFRTPTADFEAILQAALKTPTEKDNHEIRDNGASTSSPPHSLLSLPSSTSRSSSVVSAAAATIPAVVRPPPPPFFNGHSSVAAAAAAAPAASAAEAALSLGRVIMQGPGPRSETSAQNSSDEDSDSDSERSKGAGSAPLKTRSTVKRDLSNMDDQEAKKLERKRLRNRQAATKCRQKKLARISELEIQVNQERDHAKQLDYNLDLLRKQIRNLEQAIQVHAGQGCQLH
ncbi:hypothetical protein PFISCL1PPCAC_4980 [Pristionchus fissidentatus]|uniref:BZIP domain-containing protein n=1 Tax=Pristionchus fissidentatus TaxID=1538716 RepID=A0AAV5V3L0_9BILA|nr:hypothetical protein PFISCL1PPCAC_4980 [Pristionchus fissidentatus]